MGQDFIDKLRKISGPKPTKLCPTCGLYLIQENEPQCDVCKIADSCGKVAETDVVKQIPEEAGTILKNDIEASQ